MANERVYKYVLPPLADRVTLMMPAGAEPLSVMVQGNKICIWARVNLWRSPVETTFRIAGTGHDLEEDVGNHVGSFQLENGALVFHVFEVKK